MKEQLSNLPFLKKKKPAASTDDAEDLEAELAEDGDEDAAEAPAKASKKPAKTKPAAGAGWKLKLAQQVPSLAKLLKIDPAAEPSAPVSEEDATDVGLKAPAKKNNRQTIIRGTIVLGVLLAGYEILVPSEDAPEEIAPEAPAPKKRRDRRTAPPAPDATVAPVPTDATVSAPDPTPSVPSDAPAPTDTPVPADVTATTDTPTDVTIPTDAPVPTDVAATTDTPTPTDTTAPADVPGTTDAPVDSTIAADTPGPADQAPTPAPDIPSTTDVPATDAPPGPDAALPTLGGEGAVTDQVVDGVPGGEGDMTDKILEDLEKQLKANEEQNAVPVAKEYIRPPNYDYVGRGLVYNCLGKHWACIDAGSFQVCQQNHSYLKDKNKSKECYPDSVYQSNSACGWVQKSKITANTKTNFCE